MSKLSFVKYQGAGNDFILVDKRQGKAEGGRLNAEVFNHTLVSRLCHRNFGIGADGVILLEEDSEADFRMRIFNKDGSEAESCGNGLCCLTRFLIDLGLPRKSYRIATGNRVVVADFDGERVVIEMGRGFNVKPLYIRDQPVYFVDTGVPHAVVFVADVKAVDVMCEGSLLRHDPLFAPGGANVDFASLEGDDSISMRTFERGLEGESLACGTGATAVGIVAVQELKVASPVEIHCLGGDIAIQVGEAVKMVGDAVKVFEGCVSL